MNLRASSSEPGDPGVKTPTLGGPGLGGRCSNCGAVVSARGPPPKDSKVETVPQLKPLWRRLALHRGTQGSWNAPGDAAPPCWAACSRRGLEDDGQGLARPG